jgi:hypothetical protein
MDPSAAFLVHGDLSVNGPIKFNKAMTADANLKMKSGKIINISGDIIVFNDLSVNFLSANVVDANNITAKKTIIDGRSLNVVDMLYTNKLFVNGDASFNNGKVSFNDNSVNFVRNAVISNIKDISNGSRFKSDVYFGNDIIISDPGNLTSDNLIVDVSLTVYGKTSLHGNVYVKKYFDSVNVDPSFNNVSLTKGSDIYITNLGIKHSVLSKLISINNRLKALEI